LSSRRTNQAVAAAGALRAEVEQAEPAQPRVLCKDEQTRELPADGRKARPTKIVQSASQGAKSRQHYTGSASGTHQQARTTGTHVVRATVKQPTLTRSEHEPRSGNEEQEDLDVRALLAALDCQQRVEPCRAAQKSQQSARQTHRSETVSVTENTAVRRNGVDSSAGAKAAVKRLTSKK
jgi:hypothetical protein